MRFFKVEEIDEDTFTKQGGSYESIFVSGSQRGKDGAVYAFVDETEDEFEIYLDEFAEEEFKQALRKKNADNQPLGNIFD